MVKRIIDGEELEFSEEEAIVFDTIVEAVKGLQTPLEATLYLASLADDEVKLDAECNMVPVTA